MTKRGWNMKLFTGNANPILAQEIADFLQTPLSGATVSHFSDGEINVAINESVRGEDIFLIQPVSPPNVNENLMELLIMIDALKRASSARINAVIPYFGYARQDRKSKAREPITAKLVANLITMAGTDRVIAVDLHANQIQGFFDILLDHLPGVPIITEYLQALELQNNCVVLSPDVGGVTRARNLADKLHAPLAIIDKRRPEPNVSEVMNVIGDVENQKVVIVDDIIDTAGTVCSAAQVMIDNGAKEVYVCGTHPIFSGPALDRLSEAPIKEIIVTNTIPVPPEKRLPTLQVLSMAPLLGAAISRIHRDLSVSKLFEPPRNKDPEKIK